LVEKAKNESASRDIAGSAVEVLVGLYGKRIKKNPSLAISLEAR
jgi:hypothetical protein